MSQYESSQIRNLAIAGHGDAGKTSFVSALLFTAGATNRLLSVLDGNTITDHDDDEIRRKISISTGICSIVWKKTKINILDTPGYSDFICDAFPALRSSDIAVLVVNAGSPIEFNLERIWESKADIPHARAFVINKLDRENTDFTKVIHDLRENFATKIVPISLPVGKDASFSGIIDLIDEKYLKYDESGSGKASSSPIPSDMADEIEEARTMMIETVAEADDALLEKYLEGGKINPDEIRSALKAGIREGKIYPAFPVSSTKNIGVSYFLDFCNDYFPSPDSAISQVTCGQNISNDPSKPLIAQVFKTIIDPYTGKISVFRVYSGTMRTDTTVKNSTQDESEKIANLFFPHGKTPNATQSITAGDIGCTSKLKETKTGHTLCDNQLNIQLPLIEYPRPLFSYAFTPATKSDEEKISSSLTRLAEEDPTLKYERNSETNELIVSGMGLLHLEVTQDRLKRKYGVTALVKTPKIPYKETIKGSADVRYRHKKQSGGAGQFGEVAIRLLPGPRATGFVFADMIVGGVIPNQYIPSVEKGVRTQMVSGILAGYQVVDIRVELYDGKAHPVDSKDIAFQIAGAMALKQAFLEAKPILLEPIMKVRVVVPEAFMGDIIGMLNSKRGRVLGMDSEGRKQVVNASVPMAEMMMFEPELRSITGGRGSYLMDFDHYEELPAHLTDSIIAEAKKGKEE